MNFIEKLTPIALFIHFTYSSNFVMVTSNGSEIVGTKLFSIFENKPYGAFWKIPYAVAPIRDLRFKLPRPFPNWESDISYDYSRPYNDTCSFGFTEDCLFLNIFMPITEDITSFPIIVWIYEHSNLYEPDFFIDENVLVVTISYRTSILGFLNAGDDFAMGNMGAKDILMALKWITDNITVFDGNPSKVTVIGSGDAADIVAALPLSKLAKGLFSRVIIQSGSALSPKNFYKNPLKILKKLYFKLNGPLNKFNREELYELLSEASIKELMRVSEDLFDSTEVKNEQRLINPFGLTEELAKDTFISKHPLEVYKRGMSNNDIDAMYGFTNLEALHKLKGFIQNKKLLKYLNYNFQYLLPFEGEPDEYESQRYRTIRRRIMDFNFSNGTITQRSFRRYAKYVSDQVIYPLLRQARLHSEVSCNNVYVYRFTLRGPLSTDTEDLNYTAAAAGDEICYLFKCKSLNSVYRTVDRNGREFIKKMARLWTNFAKCGNPTPSKEDSILDNLKWKPLCRKRLNGMQLGMKMKILDLPEQKRVRFWDELMHNFFPEKILHEEL